MDSEARTRARIVTASFAAAVAIAIAVAFVTTMRSVDSKRVGNDVPPGTTGQARPNTPYSAR